MLSANGVYVTVGPHVLLDNFTAEFAAGELVIVVGPNGAGKTTLLRCLDGELTPTRGGIEFARRPIGEWRRNDLARKRAVLPQQSTLDFPFSVTDVVLMGRMPHPTPDRENRAIADLMLEWCDCTGLGERAYTSLSGGEQQRVQIARVLAQIRDPRESTGRFLLLDEPVSALDLSHQYALLRLLKRLSSRRQNRHRLHPPQPQPGGAIRRPRDCHGPRNAGDRRRARCGIHRRVGTPRFPPGGFHPATP